MLPPRFKRYGVLCMSYFFFSSRRRHTRCLSDWSSDVCSSDLLQPLDQLHLTGVIDRMTRDPEYETEALGRGRGRRDRARLDGSDQLSQALLFGLEDRKSVV